MLSFRNIMRTKIMKPEMSIYTALVIPYDRLQSGDVKTLESTSTTLQHLHGELHLLQRRCSDTQ
jgi:hypothetical protein